MPDQWQYAVYISITTLFALLYLTVKFKMLEVSLERIFLKGSRNLITKEQENFIAASNTINQKQNKSQIIPIVKNKVLNH